MKKLYVIASMILLLLFTGCGEDSSNGTTTPESVLNPTVENNETQTETPASESEPSETNTTTPTDENNTTPPVVVLDITPLTFTSSNTFSVSENQTAVGSVTTDDTSATLTLSGADTYAFNFDSSTGALNFKTFPEYNYKSSYIFTATASDGTNETNQTIVVNVIEVGISITDLSSFVLSGDANWSEDNATFTSGDITDFQSSCIELNSTTNTSISFDWDVSSESNYDFLRFYINDVEKTNISGSVATTSLSYSLSENDILKWCYTKDGSAFSGTDSGSLSNIRLGVSNNSPSFVANESIVTENQTVAIELNVTDLNNDTLTYGIKNDDFESFEVDSSTGVVNFKVVPTFDVSSDNIYNFTATANDGVNVTEQNISIIVKSEPFTYNGTEYQAIVSPYTGKIWLDRNLGATQACTAFDDTTCYGDYYQWGRDSDGHEKSTSDTNTTIATTLDPAHGDFILDGDNADDDGAQYDWLSEDDDGSLRSASWSKTDGTSICPVGYRVPTIAELEAETTSASTPVANRDDAFSNFLKLPSAGGRSSSSGSMGSRGSYGRVWSSSVDGSYSGYLRFYSSGAYTDSSNRAGGLSVRCLRD